jgi:WD40 repeat protein
VAVLPDGKRAISASRDNTVRLWSLNSGEALATFSADGPIWACAVAGDTIIAGDDWGLVHFLRIVNPRI